MSIKLEEKELAIKLRKEYDDKAKEIAKLDDLTLEWFNAIDENRKLFYKAIKHERSFLDSLPEDLKEEFNSKNGFEKKDFSNNTYNYHPYVTDYNRKNYIDVLTSMSGKTKEEIIEIVKNKMAAGMDETEAYRTAFKELPLRKDKFFIALDLETASPSEVDLRGKFDFGARTEIIEIGYLKVSLDEEKNFTPLHYSELFGVHKDLFDTNGTGLVEVHNITKEMVEGKDRFIENDEAQLALYHILKNCVLVAHNARFEIGQLSHHLKGFNKLYKSGNLEILDTMHVSKFYMPENERNTNECFVESTGGQYENAHRAYDDAVMSFNSLMRLKGLSEFEKKEF